MRHLLQQGHQQDRSLNVGVGPKENPAKVSWISNSIKHPDKFTGAVGYAEMRELYQDGRD
jgi:hypothetical protein